VGFNTKGAGMAVCPTGEAPVPKISYRPGVNGCGPTGLRDRSGDRFGMHECCNGHDTCYGSCGMAFSACETAFETCLTNKCRGQARHPPSPLARLGAWLREL
jgi:secretory phospholipase A2